MRLTDPDIAIGLYPFQKSTDNQLRSPFRSIQVIAVISTLLILLVLVSLAAIQQYSELQHPTLRIWTLSQPIDTKGLLHGVPDTFDYYINYSSSVPVGVAVLNTNQFVQFANCPYAVAASRLSCVMGNYASFPPTTSQNQIFTLAEGCGAYIAIYYASTSGTFYPNISIRYNPAPALTGLCAGS